MDDFHRFGDKKTHAPNKSDGVKSVDFDHDARLLDENDPENVSKIVRGTAKSRSYRIAMNMPAEMSFSSSSNDTTIEPDPSTAALTTDVADWNESSVNGRHLWVDTDTSGTVCYLTDHCLKSGPRKKCSACKIIVHSRCIEQLEKINFKCKLTFREINSRGFHENTVRHHWVHRRKQDGKCNSCGKSFQHMLSFQNKDIIAISCSWCKTAYHNKSDCFGREKIEEFCELGPHANVIVPPSWVVKLPQPKKSRQMSMKRNSSFRKNKPLKRKSTKERRPFVIKPSGSAQKKPLLVFINPRSGGNQGLKIMHKFQWLLNPRQVFDLNRGGPRPGLELYRKVPNLRILACGGDGTVGWVLSELDKMKITPPPPVAVLPLGTGNDLARFLCWGGGYTDEPLSKILMHVDEGKVVQLDRWNLEVAPNDMADVGIEEDLPSIIEKDDDSTGETALTGKQPNHHKQPPQSNLPLNVVNNYFSLGFDAEVCLEFHETREAHPDKFNSRLGNLYFYGKAGSRTYLQSKSRGFFKKIKLECDGQDVTEKIQELKPLCLLFLNISKYSAGTEPWGNPGRDNDFLSQRCDDGYLEVLGLTSTSLATTRMGTGHGERIAQCKNAKLTTTKTLPFQVDGEPCRLLPSIIRISRRNQVNMIERIKHRSSTISTGPLPTPENVRVQIYRVTFKDYEKHCYDLKDLRETATILATTEVEPDSDLEKLRTWIDAFRSEEEDVLRMISVPTGQKSALSDEWCFLDTTYPDRVYRLDKAQEKIYNVIDILEDGIFVVDLKQESELNLDYSRRDQHSSMKCTNSQQSTERPLYERNMSTTSETVEDIAESTIMTPFSGDKKFTLPSGNSSETDIWVKHPAPKTDEEEMIEAAKNGDLSKIIRLHRSGTSLSAGDQRGWRPLHYAARHGYKDIVRYIISNVPRCVLDLVEEENGQTALHKAAFYERRTICSILVQAGASLTRADLCGNTPKIQAKQAKDLAKYLETQEHLQMIASEDFETAV